MAKRRRRRSPSAEQLRAATSPYPPGQSYGGGITWLVVPRRLGSITVNEETALQYATVWACVRVITEDIASLPWHVMRRRPDGGKDIDTSHPVDWLLDVQSSPEVGAFQFRETILAHTLLWGNGYAEIERDALGRPVWLHLLTPDRVCPERDYAGNLVYRVSNYRGPDTYLPAEDVFHLKGLGYDGIVGYSVIRMMARAILIGVAQEQFAGDYFENDSTPGGLLKHPAKLSDKAKDNIVKAWERRHMGPDKRRRVAVLEEGMDWVATGLPPEDSQLLQSRQFQPEEICRIFRVSPHKVQHLLRATFSNIEHLSLDHVNDTLMPWIRRLESEGDIKLIGRNSRGHVVTKINTKKRLRGDTASRVSRITSLLSWGVMDINEARIEEEMNPIPDGSEHFVPVNMQLLETAVNPPEPAPPPEPPLGAEQPEEEEEEEAEPEANGDTEGLRNAFHPLFLDAYRRIARRAQKEVENRKKNYPEGWQKKLAPWWPKLKTYAREQLEPLALTFAAIGHEDVGWGCPVASLRELAKQESPDWDGWAVTQTGEAFASRLQRNQVQHGDDQAISTTGKISLVKSEQPSGSQVNGCGG